MVTMPRANAGRWVRFIAQRAYGRTCPRQITRGGDFSATTWRDAESPERGTGSARPPPMITTRMGRVRLYWSDRFGLRARMAASYVLVTAAAVIVVEAIVIAFTIPSLLPARTSPRACATPHMRSLMPRRARAHHRRSCCFHPATCWAKRTDHWDLGRRRRRQT